MNHHAGMKPTAGMANTRDEEALAAFRLLPPDAQTVAMMRLLHLLSNPAIVITVPGFKAPLTARQYVSGLRGIRYVPEPHVIYSADYELLSRPTVRASRQKALGMSA
jgi:hypothetical protein